LEQRHGLPIKRHEGVATQPLLFMAGHGIVEISATQQL
jgi:hypothetical protein